MPISGFNNVGSICHFNALLQALLSLQPFVKCIDGLTYDKNALVRYFKSAETSAHDFSANVMHILLMIRQHRGESMQFSFGQQSAHEGFMFLIDALNQHTRNAIENTFVVRHSVVYQCIACKHIISDKKEDNVIFEMYTDTQFSSSEGFRDYILSHSMPLDELKCNNCGAFIRNTSVKWNLRRVSDVLVIAFQKYTQKNMVWFPQYMNFPGNNGNMHYELCAQIEHSGSLHGGHYYAIVKRDNQVYLVDDMTVRPHQFGPTNDTYIVCYQRV